MAEDGPPSAFDQAWSLMVLRSIADGVIACDADDRITFLNPAAETLTGWSLEKAGGRPITEVFRPTDETTGRPIDWPSQVRLVKSALLMRRDGRTLLIEVVSHPSRTRRDDGPGRLSSSTALTTGGGPRRVCGGPTSSWSNGSVSEPPNWRRPTRCSASRSPNARGPTRS